MAKKRTSTHGGRRNGAGRKPAHSEGSTMKIAASMPFDLVTQIEDFAGEKGWSRSKAVTEAVRRLLKSRR